MMTLITALASVIATIVYGGILVTLLFYLFCMNVFTIPLFLLLYLVCCLLKVKRPRMRMYGLMTYPSWRSEPRFTFVGTIEWWFARQERKAKEKMRRKRFYVTHAWEERFFM